MSEMVEAGVWLVTLNRPDNMNTLSPDLLEGFRLAMAEATANPKVRAVAVTGAGRAFCAGADLAASVRRAAAAGPAGANGAAGADGAREAPRRGFLSSVASMDVLHAQFAGAGYACPKPTVGLINGPAAGAGFGLALGLDFRIAAQQAIFVSAFARIALSGDNGITYGLSRLVGRAKALEILMLSPRISAAEALELGLVREVVADDKLMEVGLELCGRLAAGPTTIFSVMKRNLAFAELSTYQAALEQEAAGIAISQSSDDHQGAIQAFLEKREPTFGS
jgi:2-(1,2-epoxy-1,2-dihydrophenyl)acetyl-CoA isomerase